MKLKSFNIGFDFIKDVQTAHLTKIIEMQSVCTSMETQLMKYYKDQLLRDIEVMKKTLKRYETGMFTDWTQID